MHISTCEHPVFIHRNGISRYVPCGKCITCRYIRQASMTDRLNYEIQQHKYGVFGSLSYADLFLPKFFYDQHNRGFVSFSPETSFDRDSDGLFVSFPYLYNVSKKFVDQSIEKYGFVSFLSKADAQKFMKRLRININRYFKKFYPNEYETFNLEVTYALCGEYGPSTYRPHFHFIILFDCDELAKVIFSLIRKSWPFGSSKSRFLQAGESGQYISKYVNGLYRLPKVLQSKEFRPFLLVSKSHALGLYKVTSQAITESFKKRSATISIFNTKKGTFCELPLWRVLENRLYPKFSGYDRLSDRFRIRLLECAARFETISDFQKYCFPNTYFLLNKEEVSPSNLISNDYTIWLANVDLHVVHDEYLRTYLQLYGRNRPYITSVRSEFVNALKNLFYCAHRIVRNMHTYCINSFEDYLKIIEEYDYNKFVYRMTGQFELESNLDLCMLKYIDCECFSDEVINHSDFQTFKHNVEMEYAHSKKNRENNYYLNLHPERKLDLSSDDFTEGFV